ncbi:hypothetical protein H0A36_26230 [Endozoicomonas sp. SM1973]|uniref:HTH marR-type domain-containing protein n=1 Tax=Spartinivicinus marinus TaxID=2994442 RepID=A0A853I6I3_9GAMM|nr:hypothetical protein [Spartinivicinus marinus]MCX4030492.1 hypothetical protein [Spartinivicinus marinus]NYZ69520.1 hypothetical protein [Spartinivicinus marinus]
MSDLKTDSLTSALQVFRDIDPSLTIDQLIVLLTLGKEGPLRSADIKQKLNLSHHNFADVIEPLFNGHTIRKQSNASFIESGTYADDHRQRVVYVNDDGMKVLKTALSHLS